MKSNRTRLAFSRAEHRRQARRRLNLECLEGRRLLAGPYAPAAGEVGSDAIGIDDSQIVAWATRVVDYSPGTDVDVEFQTPAKALGPAVAGVLDTVSLGRGGQLTLAFNKPIRDGLGADFAVFENAATDNFLELGFVEVSSNGTDFFRFDNDSLTPSAVGAFGEVDPTNIHNLAGKYRAGFATPFDLAELDGVSPLLDVTSVMHVRLIDIVGDGSVLDTSGDAIFDPFPTTGSAGIDIESVAVIHQSENLRTIVGFEDVGQSLAPESEFNGPVPDGVSQPGPFGDTVIVGSFQTETLSLNNSYSVDFDSWVGFAYSNHTDNTTPGFQNQYSAFAGGGASGSTTYGVGFPESQITRAVDDGRRFQSLAISNTTYAALSMLNGDSFAKKFGGLSGDDPDFLLLSITGKDESGVDIGVVDFYLADYRFADNSLDSIVDAWATVDLSSIADARSLHFSIDSSDVGPFGINTPTYFAIDDIVLVQSALSIDIAEASVAEAAGANATTVRISRPAGDLTLPLEVNLVADQPAMVNIPASVTIPAGQRFVEFQVGIVDNSIDENDRVVTLTASSPGFGGSNVTFTIVDDDQRSLALSLAASTVTEGGTVDATITRIGQDLSQPLVVMIEATPSIISVPQTVTIPAGESIFVFSVESIDNDVVDADQTVTIMASAAGFTTVVSMLMVINDDVPVPTLTLTLDRNQLSESDAAKEIGFEDFGVKMADESFRNGSDLSGGFDSGQIRLNNTFDPTFGVWGGWSISNTTDATTAGFGNQYSAIAGNGSRGSATYAVASAFPGGTVPTITIDDSASGQSFQSLRLTNTTYAALSMERGDAFAKKFGGATGDDPDFFLVTIDGLDLTGSLIGSVDFYLADFRFDDNSLDYIVGDWTTVDLSSLASANSLAFSVTSSDVGMFGINTPTYFAMDDIQLSQPDPMVATGTVTRSDGDLSEALTVTLVATNADEVVIPTLITIPAGSASETFAVRSVDDVVVDGDVNVQISASALFHTASMASLTIQDDDSAATTLSLSRESISEAGGGDPLRLVVHRNTADQASELVVQLDGSRDDLDFPDTVVIPVGVSAIEIPIGAIDNPTLDGDRTASIVATSPSFQSGSASLQILDDELPGILVDRADEGVVVTEWTTTDMFSVTLTARPLTDVVIDIASSASDVTLDRTRLTFTPANWNLPQSVVVAAIGDLLLEADVESTLELTVVVASSDAGFAITPIATVGVTVKDYQPTSLRIGEDDATLFLTDEDIPLTIVQGANDEGIRVLLSDAAQTLTLDPLVLSRGLIQVDTGGGEDTVVVRGTRFTSIDGGDGFDRLVVDSMLTNDLASFLDNHVVGFEEIVISRGVADTLTIDAEKLAFLPPSTTIKLRTSMNPQLQFVGSFDIGEPVVTADGFAQVIQFGAIDIQIISDSPWQNAFDVWDVNHSGGVTSLDALTVINQLARVSDSALPPINGLEDFTGNFFDVSGDGRITALDALRVINELARRANVVAPEEVVRPIIRLSFERDPRDVAIEELFGAAIENR